MTHSYDSSSQVTGIKAQKGSSAPLIHLTYEYLFDDAGTMRNTGLRHKLDDLVAGTRTVYDYDGLDRLTDAHTTLISSGATQERYEYAYDANSNRTSQTINGTTTSFTYNPASQLTTSAGGSFTYDQVGNEKTNNANRTLKYNARNQTREAAVGSDVAGLIYAGADQLELAKTGIDTWANSLLGLSSRSGPSGTPTYYTRDDQGTILAARDGTHRDFHLHDALGSVIGMTGSAGTLTGSYCYEPYGKLTQQTGNYSRFLWLGNRHGTGELYKFGHRWYDPATGRWTQADPLLLPDDSRQANRYGYAAGDPINLTDPHGTCVGPVSRACAGAARAVGRAAVATGRAAGRAVRAGAESRVG